MRRGFGRVAEAGFVFGLGVGIGLLNVCADLGLFDEPMILVGSERVLRGELPFRDFYALYPPGQYYVVAGLMRCFGESALVLRLYCIAVRALIALLLFLMTRDVVGRPFAWAGWAGSILWLSTCGFYGYPMFPALCLVLCALATLASCADRRRAGAPVRTPVLLGAGALMGAAALIRHDLAFYGFLASLPLMFALTREGKSRRWWSYLAGIAACFGLPMACLLAVVPFREVIFELVSYPFSSYAQVRGLPYPVLLPYPLDRVLAEPRLLIGLLDDWPAYTPLLYCLLGAFVWAARVRSRGRTAFFDPRHLRILTLVILVGLAFNLARVRADMIHGMAMLVTSYAVAAMLFGEAWSSSRAWRIPVLAGVVATAPLSLSIPLSYSIRMVEADFAMMGPDEESEGHRCRAAGDDREAAAAYLRSVVPQDGRIFVGCARHDMIFANEPILYFLSDRLPGTRYHTLDPGVATTLEVQREIVDGLVRYGVDYLALSSAFADRREPNQSAASSGVTYLDDYLRAHYRPDRQFGPLLTVWKRVDEAATR